MPRNHHPATSALRNRNRITNKTRLKIHQGALEADAVLIPDEEEEKHRLTNLVAGVDAEDANEHHLQEVLSAARHAHGPHKDKVGERHVPPTTAYIPIPDSAGVVDNYEQFYPTDRWKDPHSYVCTSSTVEDCIVNGLANGFTYYMDERDKEWLDKNNEEARGEGTSAQGAVSASGTRTSARSAKAKGKEPEPSQPAMITEDEFELIMGILEKVTHERTEYLHHSLEGGMEFPPFSDYQDVFSSPLPSSMFATYTVPEWIPPPATLLRIAKAIYPYWKERRIERGGHRIIPALNGDETDTFNESYICFRRRESKAVRKTRAQQVTSSDKLARLQQEFAYPLQIAKLILERETMKKEVMAQSQAVWEKRMAFADLKRKFPSFNDKADEELLIDKERPVKKVEPPRLAGTLKIRTGESASTALRQELRPRERAQMLRDAVEKRMAVCKDQDHHWEDQVDSGYQNQPSSYACRLFKFVPPAASTGPHSDASDEEPSSPPSLPRRAIRSRYGRGGRIFLDRRDTARRNVLQDIQRSSLFALNEDPEAMAVDEKETAAAEREEENRRLLERWRFDSDDGPAAGPEGAEEQDRELVDDYNAKYLRHSMTLLNDVDYVHLHTDPSLLITNPEGRPQVVMPYRLGIAHPFIRRDGQPVARFPANVQPSPAGQPSGTPVAMQQALKKMAPPTTQQMRISSNGGMRPPALPVPIPATNGTTNPVCTPQPLSLPVPQPSPGGTNGSGRAAISMPHVEVPKPDIITTPAIPPAVVAITQSQASQSSDSTQSEALVSGTPPPRPKTTNPTPTPQQHVALGVPTNGFHLTPMTNIPTGVQPQSQHSSGLSIQQFQNIKNAFATPAEATPFQNAQRLMSTPYGHGASGNAQLSSAASINLAKIQMQSRAAMQWITPPGRPASVVNGVDTQANGAPMISSPVRSPSANGTRPVLRNGTHVNGINGQHSILPLQQHTASPLPNISQSQSPPRAAMTPALGMASPSLVHTQHAVGTTQTGF